MNKSFFIFQPNHIIPVLTCSKFTVSLEHKYNKYFTPRKICKWTLMACRGTREGLYTCQGVVRSRLESNNSPNIHQEHIYASTYGPLFLCFLMDWCGDGWLHERVNLSQPTRFRMCTLDTLAGKKNQDYNKT